MDATVNDLPWYDPEFEGDDNDRAAAMLKVADGLDASPIESSRRDDNLLMARMFDSNTAASLYQYVGGPYAGAPSTYTAGSYSEWSMWNVARSVVMTVASQIGRDRPRGLITTTEATMQEMRAAEQGSQFLLGWAHEADLYEHTYDTLVDCLWADVGAVQIFEDGGRVKVQRLMPNEVRFDPLDTLYGDIRTIYRQRYESKGYLLKFAKGKPALREAIKNAPVVDPLGTSLGRPRVRVEEAWHLPSFPGADDGYHIIGIKGQGETEGVCLFREKWTKPYLPIQILTWEKARTGITGISLMMQLAPSQHRLNRILDRIEKSQHLVLVPRVFINRGSKISKAKISNLIGEVIEGNSPPQILEWPGVAPELYAWIRELVQKMYDLPGINRDGAQGQADAHAESGEAKRISLDVQQTRLQTFAQKWEAFHCRIFEIALDMISDIAADGGYEVDVPGSLLTRVDFKKLQLAEKAFRVQIQPVNGLPATPQGRLDYVKDRLAAGLWDPDQARAALDDLDTGTHGDLATAPLRRISGQYEAMIYDGEAQQPSTVAVGNFQLALKLGMQYLALAEDKNVDEKRLDLVERYLHQLQAANAALQAPPAGGASGASGATAPGPTGAAPQIPEASAAPLSPLPQAFAAAA